MAYTTPPTKNPGDTIASADWNAYVRDNFSSLAGLIMYYNGASAPSGTTEFTAARGLFICGLVSGGTLATAVGTPLTNQQNVTHLHVITSNVGSGGSDTNGRLLVDNSGGGGFPSGTAGAPTTFNTGTASAGSIGIPYLQLLVVTHN